MPARTLPGLGLQGGWNPGENGWGAAMTANMRILSAVAGQRVLSRTTTLPGTGSEGDIFIAPVDDPTNANRIAVWDAGAWVYLVPQEGWMFRVADTDQTVQWTGSGWVLFPDPDNVQAVRVLGVGGAGYTLARLDRGKVLEVTSGSDYTVTIPAEADVAMDAGSLFTFSQIGAGRIIFVAATGVTLNGVSEGSFRTVGEYAGVTLYKRSTNGWVLQGAFEGIP